MTTSTLPIAEPQRMPSKRQPMVFVLALALAALAALGWKEGDSLRNAKEAQRSELQLQSMSLSLDLESACEAAEQTLNGVVYRLEFKPSDPGIALDMRARMLQAPALSDLRYYRADQLLAEQASLGAVAPARLPEWVRQEVALGHASGLGRDGNSLAFFRSAYSKGQTIGTVYARLSPEYILNSASQRPFTHAQASCLLDESGEVMMELDPQHACSHESSRTLIRAMDMPAGGSPVDVHSMGSQVMVVQQLRSHPLRLVQIASQEGVRQRWQESARYSLAAMLLVLVAALSFVRYWSRSERDRVQAEDALLQAQARLRANHDLLDRLSQHVPGVICQFRRYADGRLCFPYASRGLQDLFGVPASDYQQDARPVFARVLADDRTRLWVATTTSARTLTPWHQEFRIHGPNGDIRWLAGAANPVRQDDGSTLWHGFLHDITESRRQQASLKLAASVFTSAREGILITDAQGIILDVNETFTQITGYSRAEAVGQTPRLLNSGRQSPEFYSELWKSLNNKGHWYGEVWNRRKDGAVYAEMLTISSVRDSQDQIQNYVALFSDITPLKEHQKQLEHIAHYDALTGLPNRVLLGDRLQQALAQIQRRQLALAVVFIDLDGFKAINDSHGHAAGDVLLITLAHRMEQALREGDTLARLGGDEFVAVLADLGQPQACEPILQRLLQMASEPVRLGEVDLRVSASMGVTLSPQDGMEVDLLMRQADQAMYAAKQSGKNRYHFFDASQDAAIRQLRSSLMRVQQALDHDEFVLHYQPKVNLQLGTVVGVEALIRWQHPQRGLLYPGEFLPAIENHPVSIRLGEWVLRTAMAQASSWARAGLSLPVSANISALQLQQESFQQHLQALLNEHPDLQPGQLELEVLETSAFEDLGKVSAIITQCKAMGVQFALDDFGTGYSSLTYLKHLPVHTLKIDQSFVRDMLEDSNDLAIVTGVIGLARAFGCQLVAEGVEREEHQKMLIDLGCAVAQGYGIARPMPAHELYKWVQRRRQTGY